MAITNRIAELAQQAVQWRQYLHTIPELDLDLDKTSAFVREKLSEFAVDEIHTGFAKTGVVAVIKSGCSDRSIGLRADMDALPIAEMAEVAYKSTHSGKMHACGHDGHMSILLGVAKYLAETRNFDGTVYLYFQPGEEEAGGANIMLQQGLFDKFKPDEVYALHNWPDLEVGSFSVTNGPVMGASDTFAIKIIGKGGHGAQPHLCIDPIIVAMQIVNGLQVLVSRIANPLDSVIISTTQINAGTSPNIIANEADLSGTIRTLNPNARELVLQKMNELVENLGALSGAKIDLVISPEYPATINCDTQAEYARAVCKNIVSKGGKIISALSLASEDFSYMLQKVSGCYIYVGNGKSHGLHHPEYEFNDEAIQYGMEFFAKMVETRLNK